MRAVCTLPYNVHSMALTLSSSSSSISSTNLSFADATP